MRKRRFINETISSLRKAADKIEKDWDKFKSGVIDKEHFESEYRHVLKNWLSEIPVEIRTPNNGCKYKDTNPTCKYFEENDI
jgi:hypothetical protein